MDVEDVVTNAFEQEPATVSDAIDALAHAVIGLAISLKVQGLFLPDAFKRMVAHMGDGVGDKFEAAYDKHVKKESDR